jgi:hypothetical protein
MTSAEPWTFASAFLLPMAHANRARTSFEYVATASENDTIRISSTLEVSSKNTLHGVLRRSKPTNVAFDRLLDFRAVLNMYEYDLPSLEEVTISGNGDPSLYDCRTSPTFSCPRQVWTRATRCIGDEMTSSCGHSLIVLTHGLRFPFLDDTT